MLNFIGFIAEISHESNLEAITEVNNKAADSKHFECLINDLKSK